MPASHAGSGSGSSPPVGPAGRAWGSGHGAKVCGRRCRAASGGDVAGGQSAWRWVLAQRHACTVATDEGVDRVCCAAARRHWRPQKRVEAVGGRSCTARGLPIAGGQRRAAWAVTTAQRPQERVNVVSSRGSTARGLLNAGRQHCRFWRRTATGRRLLLALLQPDGALVVPTGCHLALAALSHACPCAPLAEPAATVSQDRQCASNDCGGSGEQQGAGESPGASATLTGTAAAAAPPSLTRSAGGSASNGADGHRGGGGGC